MNTEIKYLRRKDEDYIYAATPALLRKEDMHACDETGKLLDVISAAEATGLKPRRPDPDDANIRAQKQFDQIAENVAQALNVPKEVAAEIMKGHVLRAGDMPDLVTNENEEDTPEAKDSEKKKVRLQDMNRIEMCQYATRKFKDKAAHLKPNMPRQTIIDEIERLEIEAEISDENEE